MYSRSWTTSPNLCNRKTDLFFPRIVRSLSQQRHLMTQEQMIPHLVCSPPDPKWFVHSTTRCRKGPCSPLWCASLWLLKGTCTYVQRNLGSGTDELRQEVRDYFHAHARQCPPTTSALYTKADVVGGHCPACWIGLHSDPRGALGSECRKIQRKPQRIELGRFWPS